jgi:predicted Zn-dependent protease
MDQNCTRRYPSAPARRWRRLLGAVLLLAVAAAWPVRADIDPAVPLDELALPQPGQVTDAPAADSATVIARARALLAVDDLAAAADLVDQALDRGTPRDYALLLLAAELRAELGSPGEARALAEYAASLRADPAEAYYLLGVLNRDTAPRRAAGAFWAAHAAAGPRHLPVHAAAALGQLATTLADLGYARAAADAYGRCADALAQLDEAQRAAAPLKQLDLPSGAVLLARRVELLQRAQAAPTDVLAVTRRAAEQHPTDAGVARLHVEALLAAGQADEAWRASQPFLYDAASREDFTGLAVRSAAEAGRLDAWLAELARAVHDGAPPAMPRALAAELASGPRAAAAVPLWQALLARQPDDAHLAWVLANTLRATGRLEEALLVLVRLVRANPDITLLPDDELAAWVRGPVPTAELLALIERYATAPERDYAVDAVFGLAAAAAEQDLLADQLLAAAATARPAAALPRLAWPQVYLARHRWADALRLLELAVSDQPELAAAHALLGRACVGLDDHARAEAAFAAAVQYAPDSACHARRLGEYHLDRGNLASAQRHLQQAFTLDPTDGLALERAVEAYVAGSKFEIAQAQVDAARAAGRVPADSLRRSATLVRFADALYGAAHRDALARQHAAHPQDIGTAQRLVVAHYLADDDDAALAVLRDVLAQRPDDDEALLLLARVQTRRLEFGEVIAALARLAERYPNRHEVAVALALACRNDFQPERERAVLQRLIDTVPGRDTAWRLRSQLLESHLLFGEFDAALALLDEWVALPGGAAIVPPERARTLLMADPTTPWRSPAPSSPRTPTTPSAACCTTPCSWPLPTTSRSSPSSRPGARRRLTIRAGCAAWPRPSWRTSSPTRRSRPSPASPRARSPSTSSCAACGPAASPPPASSTTRSSSTAACCSRTSCA